MAKKDIKIANFNLLNLNLPGQPIYDGDGWTDEQYKACLLYTSRCV